MNKAVFFAINKMVEGNEVSADIVESCKYLENNGYLIFVIGNLPEVSIDVANQLCEDIFQNFPVKEFYICNHVFEADCNCRLPKIGLILDAEKRYNLNLSECWMVGDDTPYVECGLNSQMHVISMNEMKNIFGMKI